MRDPGRDLLQVVGDQDHRWHRRICGQCSQTTQQPLTCPEVQARGRLVHQDQFGVPHQGASQ